MYSEKAMKPDQKVEENRRLKAHDHLIFSVIERQAGTLSKALVEGVMNAIDAKCSRIDITLDKAGFRIVDDGQGFSNKKQIEECFETFGTPHAVDSEGRPLDAEYGTFRIGRGQLFAFASTTWRSNQWTMQVDVKNRGLDYTLIKETTESPGCTIDGRLYKELDSWRLTDACEQLVKMCQYVAVPVWLNGALISKNPAALKWDLETKDYYANYKDASSSQGLLVYQKGVYVHTLPHYSSKVSGVVVTKKNLVLNMARNDVMSSCPLMSKVKKDLREAGLKHLNLKKGVLEEAEVSGVLHAWFNDQIDAKAIRKFRLFDDVSGHAWSLEDIRKIRSHGSSWMPLTDGAIGVAFAEAGNLIGDKVIQMQRGLVLDRAILSMALGNAGVSALGEEDLVGRIRTATTPSRGQSGASLRCVELEDLAETMESKYDLIPTQQITARDQAHLDAIHSFVWAFWRMADGTMEKTRSVTLRLGHSNHALAWTDGRTYVAFDAKFFRGLYPWDKARHGQVVRLLTHELIHNEDSGGTHHHSPEFYRVFHEVVQRSEYRDAERHSWQRYLASSVRKYRKMPDKVKSMIRDELIVGLTATWQEAHEVGEYDVVYDFAGLSVNIPSTKLRNSK